MEFSENDILELLRIPTQFFLPFCPVLYVPYYLAVEDRGPTCML